MRKKEMIKRWIYGIVGSLVLCVGTVSAQRTLSLEECREMALENNAKMKNARLDVEGAREGKKEAFTKYFPNVSAVGTAFKANHGMMDMSVIPGLLELSMMDDGLLGGVTAIQPVFAGGQIVNGNKLADLALEVSRYQMRQSEDEVDKAGTVTLSDLLDAQSLLQQSRDQYTGDYTAYLIKRTEYLQATGR